MGKYNVMEVASDGSLRSSKRDLVDPAAGQVRIRVQTCSICHTDTLTLQPHPGEEEGRVPGHEAVGTIDALGDGVKGWRLGQRVGIGFLGGHCGICENCRRGNFVGCSDQPLTGITVDGGYAEIMYARPTALVAVPDGLSSIEAAPLLCAGFTPYNALLKGNARAGDLVAVQGVGGLGHLGIQYARRMGFRVAAIARGGQKEAIARELGASHYIDSTTAEVGEELKRLGGAQVIVATAAAGNASGLIAGLAHGGRLIVVGNSAQPVAVSALQLLFGHVQVTGSQTGSSIENEDNLRFAVDQNIRSMNEVMPLADAAAAYERMSSGLARFRMVLTV